MILNSREMLPQPLQHIRLQPNIQFALQFIQRKMHDIVMMQFLVPQLIAQLQPNLMQQIDFLRREPRRMRPQIKNLLRAEPA